MEQKLNIFIAGGGTGGHLYPGISLANELKKHNKDVVISFIGTKAGLETKIIPQHNFPLYFIPVGGLAGKGILNKLKVLLLFPIAFFKCTYLLFKYKPEYVIGFGGYASGPMVLTAWLFRFKTAIFESNSMPGVTNRILSKFVNLTFTVFESSKKFLGSNVLQVGFPIRDAMRPQQKNPSDKLRVLIFGGSQGARGINQTVSSAIVAHPDWLKNVVVIHQTGKSDFDIIKNKYSGIENVKCFEYLDSIQINYAWADIVICRSGASTIAELAACHKAAVLIPFPFSADNHQQKNAEELAGLGAAQLVLQENFTVDSLSNIIQNFLDHPETITMYEKNIMKFHKPNSAMQMAKYILEINVNGEI